MGDPAKHPPKQMWILFDVSNEDFPTRNYTWWFRTKREALEHLQEQRFNPGGAELSGPFFYWAGQTTLG